MDRNDVVKHLIIKGVKFTDRAETYSSVFAVDYNGITCAAKELHRLLLEGASRSEIQKLKENFLQECSQHSKLHHPNIVKMLGVCYPNDQAVLPVLVMELMECNLTQLLQNYKNIPMYVKLSILQDVSKAICYLHTLNPPLMHRDLTSNNILLTTSLVAKVSNFAVLMEVSPLSSERMTICPGIEDFMPPEAFLFDPHYGLPLDVFSFGCVVCHVITQQWPAPLSWVRINPTTNKQKVLSEIERFNRYVDQISEGSLKQLVITCLDNDQKRRPPISLVSERITSIITDYYSNDDNIKMAYSLAMKEGEAEPRDLQVLLVGAENTGKTSLISSFLGEEFVVEQSATEGAEVEVCKVYSKNWSRISESDKTNLLHDQFIDQFRGSALKTTFPLRSDKSSAPSGQNVANPTSAVFTESVSPLPTNSADYYVPEPHPQDMMEASSNTIQYDADTLNAVVWDFPGQVIYHNSHSVFISESGVPVITFNASGELNDEVVAREGSPQPPECHTVSSSIHYWLQVVDSMCSVKEKVLLAGTHIDKIHPDIKKARQIAKNRILPQLEKQLHRKPYAHYLFGYSEGLLSALEQCCFFVSNKCRDEEIEQLKSTLVKAASSLRQKLPIFFLKIERALLQHKESIISKSMMLDMVIKVTFPIAESSSEFDGIVRYFHDKRTILYFGEIESLKDLVILSPNWLAKLFSYIIAAQSYKTGTVVDGAWERLTKYGILEESLLLYMLDKFHSDYPSVLHVTKQQVIDILLSFHLVARITREAWFSEEGCPSPPDCGDTFIVPSLVPRDDDKNIPNTKQERIVYFRFRAGFVPTSLLNQLIADCICCNVKRNDRLLWMRHGKVGLQLGRHQKYYISRCEEKQSIQLTITVKGDDKRSLEERRELIDDVTQLLDSIMKVFMREVKKPTLMVPCPWCPILHITLSEVSTGHTIFCPQSNDAPLPLDYYGELIPSQSNPSVHTINDTTSTSNISVSADKMLEVFTDHYSKLQNILPLNNLSGRFVSERIITFEEEQVIQQTVVQSQATSIVLRKIANSLKAGHTRSFDKLLSIMKDHGGLSCEELANQIRGELSKNTSAPHQVSPPGRRTCILL